MKITPKSQNEMFKYLETLQLEGYLSSVQLVEETWVRRSFLIEIDSISDENPIKDDLMEMRFKAVLKAEFHVKDLGEFWCSLSEAYYILVERAMSVFVPFATTYLCEAGFSVSV